MCGRNINLGPYLKVCVSQKVWKYSHIMKKMQMHFPGIDGLHQIYFLIRYISCLAICHNVRDNTGCGRGDVLV